MRRVDKVVAFYDVDALLIKIEIVMGVQLFDLLITTRTLGRHVFFTVHDFLVLGLIEDLLLDLDRLLVVANIVNR